MQSGHVRISIMNDGDRTVAEASLHTYLHPSVPATGSSSREPGDKSDPEIGEALAIARALHKIANRLEKQANGKMRHRESNLAHKREIAEINRGALINTMVDNYLTRK